MLSNNIINIEYKIQIIPEGKYDARCSEGAKYSHFLTQVNLKTKYNLTFFSTFEASGGEVIYNFLFKNSID